MICEVVVRRQEWEQCEVLVVVSRVAAFELLAVTVLSLACRGPGVLLLRCLCAALTECCGVVVWRAWRVSGERQYE